MEKKEEQNVEDRRWETGVDGKEKLQNRWKEGRTGQMERRKDRIDAKNGEGQVDEDRIDGKKEGQDRWKEVRTGTGGKEKEDR